MNVIDLRGRPVTTSPREDATVAFQEKIGAPVGFSLVIVGSEHGTAQLARAATMLSLLSNETKGMYRANRKDERLMRAQLMLEELAEVLRGLAENNEEATLDGLADLAYVTEGTATTFGLPLGWAFDEVHRSNMSKGEVKHADGVKGKGDGYQPPQILKLLQRFRALQRAYEYSKDPS
jgi:predicted HAD superfamily Cof-like phosphohydrolase